MSSLKKGEESIEYMRILSNPIRQRILVIISEQGSISFTSLKDELELTDGSLFYHLKTLNQYIQKDQQNFYQLSDEGKIIVTTKIQQVSVPVVEVKEKGWILDKISFLDLFYYFYGDPLRSIIELNILLVVVAWLFGVTNSHFSSIEQILSGGAIINGIISIFHWYLYFSLIILFLKSIKCEVNYKELLIGVFIGIIPYVLYLIPTAILFYLNIGIDNWIGIILKIVFALCKVYSTLLVIQGVNLSSNCKKYQAVVFASVLILIDYIYIMITL